VDASTTPVLVAGARTPIGRFRGALKGYSGVDLGAAAVEAALQRAPGLEPDYVVLGNVLQAANGQNPGRRAALRGGVSRTTPGITVNDVCLASLSAVGLAASMLREGEATSVLVGGFDSMTGAPHAVHVRTAGPLGNAPLIDVMVHDGLYCSIQDVGMGELSDGENARLEISRADQDEFAARSHARAAAARSQLAEEIAPVDGLTEDEGVRPETTPERLASLPAAFTREGTITAGNASQLSDGAAAGILTTARRAQEAGHEPLAEVVGRAVVAGPDSSLHLRPAEAARKLLGREGLDAEDIDLWEINEAFAGVAVASIRDLGLDPDTVNTQGGAVALGHPLAASGFRLLLTLAHQMRRTDARLGVATMCGGGGQGEAVLLRRAA
jgi:acetyl-CoA C-acetyltransferase